MKHPCYLTLLLAIIIILTGCESPDIAIMDLDTGKSKYPAQTNYRQVIVHTAENASTFSTMTKVDSKLVLKTFSPSCSLLHETSLPLFTKSYSDPTSHAMSLDLTKFLYLKNRNIYLYDLTTQKETLLLENIANSSLDIQKIAWISNSKFFIVTSDYSGSTTTSNEIFTYNIISNQKQTLYSPKYPSSYNYSLSSKARMFAFQDATKKHDIYGVIKILDMQTGKLKAVLGDGSKLIGSQHWSPDGSELAFVEGNKLMIWSLNNKKTRVLKTFPNNFSCYHVVFVNNKVGYVGSSHDSSRRPLVVLDSETGEELLTIKKHFNGRVYVLGKTNTIVAEIGY